LLIECNFQSIEHVGIADDTSLLEKFAKPQNLIQRRSGHFETLARHRRMGRGVSQSADCFVATDTAVSDANLNFKTYFENVFRNGICQNQNSTKRQAAGFDGIKRNLQLFFGNALGFDQ